MGGRPYRGSSRQEDEGDRQIPTAATCRYGCGLRPDQEPERQSAIPTEDLKQTGKSFDYRAQQLADETGAKQYSDTERCPVAASAQNINFSLGVGFSGSEQDPIISRE